MAISNFYWTLTQDGEGFILTRISDGRQLEALTLEEVRALAAIAELAGSKPRGGLAAAMGMNTIVEVKKHG